MHEWLAGRLKIAELMIVGEPDHIIEGRYCSVNCHQQAKKQGHDESWFFSPVCIPVGRTFSPETDEEWIANRISSLPSTDFFSTFISFAQVRHWIAYRDSAIGLALCFWTDGDSSWLNNELHEGRIDRFSYDYMLTEGRLFKNFWNMLKVGELDFMRILQGNWGFPFDSIRSLFVEVVREDIEDEFFTCLKNRYIYTASHIKDIAILKRRVYQSKASDSELKKLYNLIDGKRPLAKWLDRVLLVANFLCEENKSIKQYLEGYREEINNLAKLQIQRECSPDLREKHRRPSHTWKNGQYREDSPRWKI